MLRVTLGVTDADAVTETVLLGVTLGVTDAVLLEVTLGVTDAELVIEPVVAGLADAVRLADTLAVTLAEAERVRLVEGDCDVDGNGELDGEAVSATQSPAMIAATCACVSAYAKMRTLSRSPVKRPG